MRNILALAFLTISTAALADPPANTIMKVAPPNETADAKRLCAMRIEIETAQLGHLGGTLTLDAAQKPLFEAWRKIHLDVVRALPCPSPRTGLDVPAPQRLENQITLLSANLDALRREQPATDALYAALNPSQRAIFDAPKQGVPPGQAAKPDAPHP